MPKSCELPGVHCKNSVLNPLWGLQRPQTSAVVSILGNGHYACAYGTQQSGVEVEGGLHEIALALY